MTVLEIAIIFENETLIQKSYYDTSKIMDRKASANLVTAFSILALDSFADEIESFSLGEYQLITKSKNLNSRDKSLDSAKIKMYAITPNYTDEKAVRKCMDIAMNQFLDRFSLIHITTKKKEIFQQFLDRLNKIFKDLGLNTEDRFKSLFA